jgi:hypothetical protein
MQRLDATDPHEHLVQMPVPARIYTVMNPSFPDLHSEHRTESAPLESHRLVVDIDAPLEQQVLHLVRRQRIANVQHHSLRVEGR